jgi:hypothetical protein
LIACRTTSYALEHSIVNFRFDDEAHHSGFASSLSTRAPPSPAFS